MKKKDHNFQSHTCCLIFTFIIIFISSEFLAAQQLAFPGAEGHGRFTTGGRGGDVKIVTNLNDSGPGSLREAIQASGARTVVFRVSGTIELNSNLNINNNDITIAGQTAPGDGICIKNYQLNVDADNVIIRYMRFRLGDDKEVEADALGGRYHSNIIIDHCSASWSVDECVSFYQNQNLTLQWSIISESLYLSTHVKGAHGYGGIWGGYNCTFHHNLLAHHTSRNPRFASDDGQEPEANVDSRNNVIYNWGGNSCYGGESSTINLVANYYKYGPATGTKDRIVEPSSKGEDVPVGKWYVEDNYVWGYPQITEDNWAGGVQGGNVADARSFEPYPYAPVLTHDAEVAFQLILADAGAVRPKRDPVDTRIIEEARTGTATYGASYGAGTGIINTPSDVGGYPLLESVEAPVDADNDGMADDWETNNGLNPADPADRNNVTANGYTQLENYINSLAVRDDYILAPAQLQASTLSSSEIMLSWKENSFDETGFSIERSANDTSSFTEIAVVGTDDTTYMDSGLTEATIYYYRVRAVKNDFKSIAARLASDKTTYTDGRPLEPENPLPENSAENVPVAAVLKWHDGDAATSYDVYLDTENPPQTLLGNTTQSYFDPHGLLDSTIYYWRIDALNSNGKTTGYTWQFTSEPYVKKIHAYWDFNRGFGSLVQDASGFANSARFNNMLSTTAWVIDQGVSGSAMQFDGIDDYLNVYDNHSVNFSIRSFTINFWLKQGSSDKVMPWVSKSNYENESFGARYELFSDAAGQVNFLVADTLQSSLVKADNSAFFSDQWVMVTAVRDSEDGTLKIYLNDQLQASAPDSSYNVNCEGDLLIATNGALQDYFEGQIDELRLYNYALDQSQISDLYTGVNAIEDQGFLPRKLQLTNYPNPFNNVTMINYQLSINSDVELSVYNLLGQKVATLVKGSKTAGSYTFYYDAGGMSSGIYLFKLESNNKSVIKKVVLLK